MGCISSSQLDVHIHQDGRGGGFPWGGGGGAANFGARDLSCSKSGFRLFAQ